MRRLMMDVSAAFSAGALGGLVNAVLIWLFGAVEINKMMGVEMAPELGPGYLYGKIVWGGVWGFVFLIPLLKSKTLLRGLIMSLAPTLVQLYIVFPMNAEHGIMGLELGALTPLLVIFFNFAWGAVAAYWYKFARG